MVISLVGVINPEFRPVFQCLEALAPQNKRDSIGLNARKACGRNSGGTSGNPRPGTYVALQQICTAVHNFVQGV
jgi:hypothetical protein